MKATSIAIFAVLWRFIFWMWSLLIIGAIAGIVGNTCFTYLTTGSINFKDPRTLTVAMWFNAHIIPCIIIFTFILLIMLCSCLAYLQQQHAVQKQQQQYEHLLKTISKGVQQTPNDHSSTNISKPLETINREIPPQKIWYVPYLHNSLFEGRDSVLHLLHENLSAHKLTALTQPQAITGIGGIGKTQTAVEYAYRYHENYQAVLWVNAETEESLLSGMTIFAQESALNLPQKDEKEQRVIVNAIIHWLNTATSHWLLILDNVEDINMISTALFQRTPVALQANKGYILLTTRLQAMGNYINRIEIETLNKEEGARFLLRGSRRNYPTKEDYAIAQTIVEVMHGLPLALDQAGAYIEETGCSLLRYLELYQNQQARPVLLQRRGGLVNDHPDSVTKTFTLSFQQIQQKNSLAANILRACAFLSAENIPEAIITKNASQLGLTIQHLTNTPYDFDQALAILYTYSLVHRNADQQTLSIHRLVQTVIHDSMSDNEQSQWAMRVIQAVNSTFPDSREYTNWTQCQQYLSHALACKALIDRWNIETKEAAQLLHQLAGYLYERAQYPEAKPLFQQALVIYQKALGPEHSSTATTMHELARLYQALGRYSEAEPLYLLALDIKQKALGLEHPSTAAIMDNLAGLYLAQSLYSEAESLFQQALAIYQKALGPDHPDTAATMHELARLYQAQDRYHQAKPLFQQALAIKQKALGPEHPSTAATMHELARLYENHGRYLAAESLFQQALTIKQKALGPEHPDTAATMHELARLYQARYRYSEAESFFQQALAIYQKALGPEHPDTKIAYTSYNQLRNRR